MKFLILVCVVGVFIAVEPSSAQNQEDKHFASDDQHPEDVDAHEQQPREVVQPKPCCHPNRVKYSFVKRYFGLGRRWNDTGKYYADYTNERFAKQSSVTRSKYVVHKSLGQNYTFWNAAQTRCNLTTLSSSYLAVQNRQCIPDNAEYVPVTDNKRAGWTYNIIFGNVRYEVVKYVTRESCRLIEEYVRYIRDGDVFQIDDATMTYNSDQSFDSTVFNLPKSCPVVGTS